MPGRAIRSHIAAVISDALGSRATRNRMKEHGWTEGMPIVIAQHHERLVDALALVVVHEPPVLLVTLDPDSGSLCCTYVAIGCTDLQVVDPLEPETTVLDLYRRASLTPCLTFRVTPLAHSAIAHAVPPLPTESHAGRPGAAAATGAKHP